ncbi:(2Fe-2S)-binding protein [Pelagibius sp. CAU 1746]|uniref:(2Fe-2S)-binding protein n=1 Tax=Pelagibius sp. CAU 1746 TaxID=3140370 RepID=UPI00325A802D
MKPGNKPGGGIARAKPVGFRFDGATYEAPAGESLAAALLANGIHHLRDGPEDRRPRGAFCYMGLCQECLVEIDGAYVEACRTPISQGLEARRLRYGKAQVK